MSEKLTHLREDGSAHMVDVSDKAVTKRVATAQALFTTRPEVVQMLMTGNLPKGEALGTARIAGIMAAKRTWELIPLCHPLPRCRWTSRRRTPRCWSPRRSPPRA